MGLGLNENVRDSFRYIFSSADCMELVSVGEANGPLTVYKHMKMEMDYCEKDGYPQMLYDLMNQNRESKNKSRC